MYYFHTQPNGLPEELSDNSGHLVWTAQYSTWGSTVREEWQSYDEAGRPVQRLQQQSANQTVQLQQNLRMQGQYLDRETGLHYNTFRYYDADLGAFTTPDPIGLLGGLNLHQYAPNPISWIDPWGWSCSFDSKANRWRNNETGRFSQRPSSPADLVRNGRMNYPDIQVWARQGGLPNVFHPNPAKFPSGGFKHESAPYSIHGHGANPVAAANFPGSNAGAGPIASIKGPAGNNYRTDGTWGPFGAD